MSGMSDVLKSEGERGGRGGRGERERGERARGLNPRERAESSARVFA